MTICGVIQPNFKNLWYKADIFLPQDSHERKPRTPRLLMSTRPPKEATICLFLMSKHSWGPQL